MQSWNYQRRLMACFTNNLWKRKTGCGRRRHIAVTFDIDEHLLRRETRPFCHYVNHPQIGLMGYHEVHLVDGQDRGC